MEEKVHDREASTKHARLYSEPVGVYLDPTYRQMFSAGARCHRHVTRPFSPNIA